jgi:glucoamylase
MQLRDALDDYKHNRGDGTLFPGERRTTTGLFSGLGGRLVHVDEDGSIRDFSYPLVGWSGIARSRFGIRAADETGIETAWFDTENSVQRYHGDTALIVTNHDTIYGRVAQYDLTLDDMHVTHFDVSEVDRLVDVAASIGFAPDGCDTRIGQLHHDDVIEVFHATETDYFASATGFTSVRGSAFDGFAGLLDETSAEHPQSDPEHLGGENLLSHDNDESVLSGDVAGIISTENSATLVTLLTTRDRSRDEALDAVRTAADEYDTETLVCAAEQQVEQFTNTEQQAKQSIDSELPHADAIAADRRVISLLTGRSGLRVAGPEFDPYYAYSGGYGYSWFRDDAEVSRFLLDADRYFDLGLDHWHARSANAYAKTQLDDGTWPHRVWAFDASIAPGWANGRIETRDAINHQADQTGSVAAYLAAYDEESDYCDSDEKNDYRDSNKEDDYRDVLAQALEGLDDTLASDGRPITCQNAWEDMSGRFTHTVATFLEAYSTLAATDIDRFAERANDRADTVYDAVDDLWVEERGIYALREYGKNHDKREMGTLDTRCDSATLALASAHRAYARVGDIDEDRLDRLVSHVERVIDELLREPNPDDPSAVAGLIRYEGDSWRQHEQGHEKIWTVSTAWGAYAAATLATVLIDRDDKRADKISATARDLLSLVLPPGPLCLDSGYLPEQVFDDGTPDSATPLGWSHALRLATVALMDEYDLLETPPVAADD